MKKKILILVAVVVVLFVAAVGYAAMNLNSLIAGFKPKIEESASAAIGAAVKVGNISASAFPLPSLTIDELSTSNGDETFRLHNLSISLNLLALLRGAVAVSEIAIDSPAITLIKDGSTIRLAGLPAPKKSAGTTPAVETKPAKAESGQSASAVPLPAIELNSIKLTNASVQLVDAASKSTSPLISSLGVSTAVALGSSGLAVSGLSVTGTLLGSGALSVTGDIKGVGTPDSSLVLNGSIGKLSQEEISKLGKLFTGADLPLALGGTTSVKFAVTNTVAEPKVTATVDLTDSDISKPGTFRKRPGHTLRIDTALAMKDNVLSLTTLDTTAFSTVLGVSGTANLNSKEANLVLASNSIDLATLLAGFMSDKDPLPTSSAVTLNCPVSAAPGSIKAPACNLKGFQGSIDSAASMEGTQFTFNSKSTALSIGELISAGLQGAPSALTGKVQNLDIAIRGDTAQMPNSMAGTTTFSLNEGEIVGFNLIGSVLKAVNSLPFLTGSLADNVPESERGAMGSENTAFQSFAGSILIGNGWINLQNTKLISPLFDFESSGKLSFQKEFDLDGTMTLSKPLSAAIVAKSKDADKLLNADGRLVIPLSLRGTYPALIVYPNMKKLLELGAGKVLQEKAGKLLDGLLGGKGEKSKGFGFGF